MTTFMEKNQKQLLKKFHTLLGKTGADKEAILESYGVESSRDLSAKDLLDVCDKLAMEADPRLAELDKWRKRVLSAIFGYCRAMGREVSMEYVKGMACRAGGSGTFNQIPKARLISIYNAFKGKVKAVERVNGIARDDLLNNISLN